MRGRHIVRFDRRFEKIPMRGYILDVGPKFFLLALVSDRLWFDGFECLQIGDVRNFRRDPQARFAEAALRKRGERLPRKLRLGVRNLQELLVEAGRRFPLVAIHREKVDPDVCWIGRILQVERDWMSLLGMTPDATWEKKPERFRLSEITRVSFGGDDETALHLVGGNPEPAYED